MGLGKTLTMLANVVATLKDAAAFQSSPTSPSLATLTDVKAIANADVVLSTYHTLAGESAKTTSPLFKIHWFRIVLDEGIEHLWNNCETL